MNKKISYKLSIMTKAIAALIFAVAAVLFVADEKLPSKKYVPLSTLVDETERIAPPNGASLIEKSKNHKTSSAIVSKKYKTSLNQGEIFEHYKKTLGAAGWRHITNDTALIDSYCKGELEAEIQYNTSLSSYNFAVAWFQRGNNKCGSPTR